MELKKNIKKNKILIIKMSFRVKSNTELTTSGVNNDCCNLC